MIRRAWRADPSAVTVLAGRALLLAVLVASWSVVAGFTGPLFVAAPGAVADRLLAWGSSGMIARHAAATLASALAGLALGCAAGVAAGVALSAWPRMAAATQPCVSAAAGMPKYALLPLLVVWLGIGEAPKVWLVSALVTFPVLVGVLTGCRHVDGRLLAAAGVMGAGRWARLRLVVWPSMLPFLFAALNVAVPRAMSGAIVGELFAGNAGIGYLIEHSRQSADLAGVFAALLVAAVLIMPIHALLQRSARRIAAWSPAQRAH